MLSYSYRISQLLVVAGVASTMTLSYPTNAQQVQLSKAPITVPFGNVRTGQSQDVNITITPSGPCLVIQDGISISGPGADAFRVTYDGSKDSTYNSRNNPFIVTVRFTPVHTGSTYAELIANAHLMSPRQGSLFCHLFLIPRMLIGVGAQGQVPQPLAEPTPLPSQVDAVYIFIEGGQTSSDNPNAPVRVYLDTTKNSDGRDLKYNSIKCDEFTWTSCGASNVKYASHYDGVQIESYIQTLPQDIKVYLIGHSWGGCIAAQIAAKPGMRKIEELITIDPVDKNLDSSGPEDRDRQPAAINRPQLFNDARANVTQWKDVDATLDDSSANSSRWDGSDRAAYIGGDWGIEPMFYATFFPNDIAHHSDFHIMMRQVQLIIIQPTRQQLP
jgi:hypothetical protein